MRERSEQYDVGVIVGRFQVPALHEGHRDLIEHVAAQHDKVIIVLGLSVLPNTTNNPLDYQARAQMLREAFPDIELAYVEDMADDYKWSAKLDRVVGTLCTAAQSRVLYGARDSFITRYHGKLPTKELEPERVFDGTGVRRGIARSRTINSAEFRAGATWAAFSRYPTAYQTVDVSIEDDDGNVLVGRKPDESLYRFIGGFSDPRSESLEHDVRREVMEETGVEIGTPRYIGSRLQDDWRYRGEVDKVKTAMFRAKHLFGHPKPGDDIEEVRWFKLDTLAERDLVPEHRPLLTMLQVDILNEANREVRS
jgi:bifunctional NMN adenylyltransferase/nudix hydrolase